MLCLIVNNWLVADILMRSPKYPLLQVWHLLSLHFEKPGFLSSVSTLLCFRVMWISFPFPLQKERPHISQMFEFVSMVVMEPVLAISVVGGNRRLTRRSFRLRLRLYATMGGWGKIFLHRSLACNTGCKSDNFSLIFGNLGLYVKENITRSSFSVKDSVGLRAIPLILLMPFW